MNICIREIGTHRLQHLSILQSYDLMNARVTLHVIVEK